jgi:hypothetical protein
MVAAPMKEAINKPGNNFMRRDNAGNGILPIKNLIGKVTSEKVAALHFILIACHSPLFTSSE